MSIETCPVTGQPLSPGEFVSRAAVARLRSCVSDLPQLMGDLQYAVAGLRHGDSPAGGAVASSRPPVNLQLMLEVDEMGEALLVWARALLVHTMGSEYGVRSGDWHTVRRVIQAHADAVRRWADGPDCVDEVAYSVARLERLASPAHRRLTFVGKCAECGSDLLAGDLDFTVECRECGTGVDVDEARGAMLEGARLLVLPRPRARRVAEVLARRPIPEATVKTWCHRGRLLPVPGARPGRRLYRVADLVALAEASARRCGRT